MTNYPYFLSQLTSFVYLPIFFGIVLYEFKFTNYITVSAKSSASLRERAGAAEGSLKEEEEGEGGGRRVADDAAVTFAFRLLLFRPRLLRASSSPR